MAKIDCFLVGHNEFDIQKNKRLLLYLYGKNSHEYRDRIKYNLSQVTIGDKRYTPVELYSYFLRQEEATDTHDFDLSIITESFNLAIAYLANRLAHQGLTFDFINDFQRGKNSLRDKLLRNEIRTIGIVTTYYLSHYPIFDIVSFIRKYNNNVKIIVGGPFVISKANSMPANKLDELLETTGADYYVRDSFGEDILVDLLKCIKSTAPVSNIRNLYYREGGSFHFSYEQIENYNFNDNLIDWRLFDKRLTPVVNVRTGVSCPFKCAFCNFPLYAGKYNLSSLDNCEQELRLLHQLGIRYIQFIDDTFNVPKKRFQELLRMMIQNRFDFQWNSYFKCQYADRETVALMRESGCRFVFLGIESGSQTILDNMDKKNHVETYRACMELFHEFDIMTMCSIIVGFPGETTRTFQETFDFIEDTCPTFYQQRLWWYDRTAPIHRRRESYSIEGGGYAWRHATMDADGAHILSDRMFLDIQNSIHITEYALPFFLLGRGMQQENIKRFLRSYMHANRAQYQKPDSQCGAHLVKDMHDAVVAHLDPGAPPPSPADRQQFIAGHHEYAYKHSH